MPQNPEDINTQHILLRYLPENWQPYAALIRLDRPVGTYLAFLPALMGLNLALLYDSGSGFVDWLLLAGILFAGAWLMRSAGCIWNDWLDRDLDKNVARTRNRPIASGQISAQAALLFLVILLMLALILVLFLPPQVFWAALLILPGILLYPMMKRWIDAPQLWLGITFNAGVWVAWLAVHGTDSLIPPLLLYIGCVFWTLGYDTVYALQDLEDDEKTGIRSMARLLGTAKFSGIFVFYFLCCAFWSCLLYLLGDQASWYSIGLFGLAWLYVGVQGGLWYSRYAAGEDGAIHGSFFRQNALFGLMISMVWIV